MKQKADHHLEYLADRTERGKQLQSLLPFASRTASPSLGSVPAPGLAVVLDDAARDAGGGARNDAGGGGGLGGDDEDAAGESDDAQGDGDGAADDDADDEDFRKGGAVPAERPPLTTNLDNVPALVRTPYSIPSLSFLSLTHAGPSFSDKGKARESLHGYSPPSWYPAQERDANADANADADADADADEKSRLEGAWWGKMMDDESLITGMPAIPKMVPPEPVRRYRPKPPPPPPSPNGIIPSGVNQTVSVKAVVRRTIHNLNAARHAMHRITEFQRIEADPTSLGIHPPPRRRLSPTPAEREKAKEERIARRDSRRIENKAAQERRIRKGGHVGQEEAVSVMKKCSAGMLAHAGFEGANEMALNVFTRVAVDHLDGLGKTFRLLLDGFSHKMTPEVNSLSLSLSIYIYIFTNQTGNHSTCAS